MELVVYVDVNEGFHYHSKIVEAYLHMCSIEVIKECRDCGWLPRFRTDPGRRVCSWRGVRISKVLPLRRKDFALERRGGGGEAVWERNKNIKRNWRTEGHIPLVLSVEYSFSSFDQNFDFKIKRNHQNISYERRAYESVDVTSLLGLYFTDLRKAVLLDSKGYR